MISDTATLCGAASGSKSATPLAPQSLACFVVAAAVTGGGADGGSPPTKVSAVIDRRDSYRKRGA
jgi:hypothetical protein